MKSLLFTAALLVPLTSHAASSFDAMAASKLDLWGEEAMHQPNGASYEFFEPLLPPLRYVNADFRYYPIVLSAPNAKVKARLISNGSGVNLRGGTRSWDDVGTPVTFRVGPDELRFGEFLQRVRQPALADGYWPIATVKYLHDGQTYALEAFAATDPALAENGVVFVKFSTDGTNGIITVDVDGGLKLPAGTVVNKNGQTLLYCDNSWKLERGAFHAKISGKKSATIAIPTKPLEAPFAVTASSYDEQRAQCIATWKEILAGGMNVVTPEPYVNDAWRNLIIQNHELINGNSIHYSAGNQYDKLYEAEGSDAMLGLLVWGYEADARRLIPPLLDFTRKNLEFHQAGHKIDDVCRYYWQTRDAGFVEAMRPRWEKEANRIVNGRTAEHGLFPKEQYCGDIATPVFSLNSNAKCWMALHELSAVLADMGKTDEAERFVKVADEFRGKILAALNDNIRRETDPPFLPLALYYNEEIHDPITATRLGGYWNLMINSVIYSGILDSDPERKTWIPKYLEQHGGVTMGMIRSGGQNRTFWTGKNGVNPLYGTDYALNTLKRDDPERALVSFYGMLAQGMTRNTFIGAEGSALEPQDEGGRLFYCPPNSASNAHFLRMLRQLLIQDLDLNEDGKPETLRLCFATPKRWLEDGKTIVVERAPTAFGPVSFTLKSHLQQGEVVADVALPERNAPEKILLRARVPDGWKVVSASDGADKLAVDATGAVDISPLKGKQTIRFAVERQ